jgi:signal transduction histidine kinase
MKANAALCGLLGGFALTLHDLPLAGARRIGRLAGVLVALIAGATLVEYYAGWQLGIDELLFRDPDTPLELAPGRMAEATAWGFLMAGLALALLHSAPTPQAMLWTARCLAVGLIGLGGVAVVGLLFDWHFLIRTLAFHEMTLPSAVGLTVMGCGLVATLGPSVTPGDDHRIAALAALILAFSTSATGIASFAIIGGEVQETLAQGLGFALQSRINTITINVALRTGRAEIITSRPNLLKHLRVLVSEPGNSEARAVVQQVAESFLRHDFSGIAIALPTGVEVAKTGGFVTEPGIEVALAGAGEGSLLWRDGVFLRHRLPLVDHRGSLGTLTAEERLPKLTEILEGADAPWASAEFLLCRPNGHGTVNCFPSRHNARPFTVARGAAAISPRLAESAGFGNTLDSRGHPVVSAYDRVGTLGLVAMLKVDAAEIYGPIGRRFEGAIALLLLLSAIGSWLVWLRVRPLATALEMRVRERTADLQEANARLGESEISLRRLNVELDERVRRRTAELTAANQELEAFSYSVSHDLRAPLRHIDGFTGLLERHIEPTLDEKGRRYLRTISGSAKQMGELLDDLLSFSRIGRAELRYLPARLAELVDEVRRMLEPESAGRVIAWVIGPLPEVRGDPQLLRLVLQNLIGNALKYTRPRDQALIEIGARAEGGETVCFIRDNGVGFEMRYVDRLFVVFQRLHSSAEFEGTGIGLASVKRIIDRHGGRVWAEGEVDRGACFYFALPGDATFAAAGLGSTA